MIVAMNGSGMVAPMHNLATAPQTGEAGLRTKQAQGSFDQVKLSHTTGRESAFQKELVSRLVGEVRTCHTTGEVQQIRQAVSEGTYQVDLASIATRMMLGG